jgi:hypothetical protein
MLPINYNSYTASEYPLCKYGYGGNLCHGCIETAEYRFTRVGVHECGVCPSSAGNALKILGIFLALLLALSLLLWVNLRNVGESNTSIVVRIFLNYIQVFTLAAAFNLEWPQYLKDFFSVFD